jgi:hypothetical protein
MRIRQKVYQAALLLCLILPAGAQNISHEFWPELDIYANYSERLRIVFADSFNHDQDARSREGSFAYYCDFALLPFFRRDLRQRDNVFRRRFLTFRAGYVYSTGFGRLTSPSTSQAIAEVTARFPLFAKFVLTDRNRGELEFTKNQPFSARYRNKLGVEHDLKIWRFVFTPYIYDEAYYDTQPGKWTTNSSAIGVQTPIGHRVVIEPYWVRQTQRRPAPKNIDATGFTVSLHF